MLSDYQIIDLTHPLDEKVPTWSGNCGFRLELRLDYEDGLRVQTLKSHCGIGTHIDAPAHFIPNGKTTDQLDLKDLCAPACVLKFHNVPADFQVEVHHIEIFIKKYGPLPKGAVVIAQTGWEHRWNNPNAYRNADKDKKMHFPGFSAECAAFLAETEIAGIGIDTLSPDGSNEGFPVHLHILGKGMYILENLKNLELLPPFGAFILTLPLPFVGGTEAPSRIIGLIK